MLDECHDQGREYSPWEKEVGLIYHTLSTLPNFYVSLDCLTLLLDAKACPAIVRSVALLRLVSAKRFRKFERFSIERLTDKVIRI